MPSLKRVHRIRVHKKHLLEKVRKNAARGEIAGELRELRSTIDYLEERLTVIATGTPAATETLQGVARQALNALKTTRQLKGTEKYYGFRGKGSSR